MSDQQIAKDPVKALAERYPLCVLETLLRDCTTGRNIVWAGNEYESLGVGYGADAEIAVDKVTGRQGGVVTPRIAKEAERQSRRTKARAEVFTPSWLCNQMSNDIDEVWFGRRDVFNVETIDPNGTHAWKPTAEPIAFPKAKGHGWQCYVKSRRLEITCGEAPYLCSRYDTVTGEVLPVSSRIGILDRKLRIVGEKAKTYATWLKWAYEALRATYGFEYQGDNLLIARINVLETFAEHCEARWGKVPAPDEVYEAARIVSWNLWQMNGFTDGVPSVEASAEVRTAGDGDSMEKTPLCVLQNWETGGRFEFASLKGKDMDSKFYAVIGNPPYQEENTEAKPKSNGQKPMRNIFQYFQEATDEVTANCAALLYPGGRWIHQSGKGMKTFGLKQINDPHLAVVKFYPDASELFGNAASLSDGISVVVKKYKKKESGFSYIYSVHGEEITVQADNPGESLMPLNPNDIALVGKINSGVAENRLPFLHDAVLSRSLFPIESNFVENNPSLVHEYQSDECVDFSHEIKLFTNDKAGKAGRARWYVADKAVITKNQQYISEWQVVVSSANAGGQKRDNQLEIIDDHSAFGRSRVALRSFKTRQEANNFYKYVASTFIRFAFLLTDEALSSLAKEVPDLVDYSSSNNLIDFSGDIDMQLCDLFNITDIEFEYMRHRVEEIRISKIETHVKEMD